MSEDEPEWWGSPAREKRSTSLAIAGVLLLVSGAFGAYLMFGRSPSVAQADSADAGRPAAIEDPETLLPITLRAPLPTADEIFTSRILRFTIALDQAAKSGVLDGGGAEAAELLAAEDALRFDDVRESLGPRTATALGDMLTAAKAAARAPAED